MRISTPTELRKNLATLLQAVIDDQDPLIVHRGGPDTDVVVIPFSEWNARRLTDAIAPTPAAALELLGRIADMDAGRGVVHEPIDADGKAHAA